MGIPGLLPFLSNSTRDAHISEFENKFVAIDAYCWLHKGIYSCAFELATKKPTVKYATYCMRYIEMLLHFKVKPILVFDGRQLSSKKETEKKRREERKKKYEKGKELMRAGKHWEGRKLLGESVDVTHKLALTLMKQCREKNVDCIVAPFEADAQLAFLSIRKIVECVITEDSDLLAYGSERVMFKMDTSGRGKLIEKNQIHFSLNMTPEEFNEDLFRYMCILTGCDYLPSLQSIGPVNALKFVKLLKGENIYEALPKLPIYVNKKNVEVSPEYVTGFKIADNTFKHQLVYDPLIRAQVPLRPVKINDDIVGEKLPDEEAFNLAVGNIDPITMEVLDTYDPDKTGKGFTLLWKTDLLPSATSRQFFVLPEGKKRQREILESDPVQSITNDLKKPRTPFSISSLKSSVSKNNALKIPDNGFIFDPKISDNAKTAPKVADGPKLLKSRYFAGRKDRKRETKQTENENGRKKDESYEDYLQRLYDEYFPLGENDSEAKDESFNNTEDKTASEKSCGVCANDRTCCSCSKENSDDSATQKLQKCIKDIEELNRKREKSSVPHVLLDEIHKEQMRDSAGVEEEKEISTKVSPSQNLSINFSKLFSKLAETPKTQTEVVEKENSEDACIEEKETARSPSPVFKFQKDAKVLNRNCKLGNISDTAGTPTSVYFSSLNESQFQVLSVRTPLTSQRKMPSLKSFSSLPPKSGKNGIKSSTVNRTLFQFGFKKRPKDGNDV